jgi:Dehydrogenase E1 component
VAVLFGDGACGAGVLHETLNMAANWKLPILLVCNNNRISVSTARRDALAPVRLSDFGATFGLPPRTIDGLDVEASTNALGEAAGFVRSGQGPAFIECVSIRMRSHSTTARETRTRDECRHELGRLVNYGPRVLKYGAYGVVNVGRCELRYVRHGRTLEYSRFLNAERRCERESGRRPIIDYDDFARLALVSERRQGQTEKVSFVLRGNDNACTHGSVPMISLMCCQFAVHPSKLWRCASAYFGPHMQSISQ